MMGLKQAIPLRVQNARELGGYRTAGGNTVKSGVLLRSAALKGISDEDIRCLRDTYRLQHIVDFRMPFEQIDAEDPEIAGAAYHHLDVIDAAAMGFEGFSDVDLSKFDIGEIASYAVSSGAIDENMYIGFLANERGREAFSAFFRILLSADPDRAVLWHCTSGKDRTGLAAMLLLSALGVDEETIISDYLLTNVYFAPRIEATAQLLKERGCDDGFIKKSVLVFDGVDERFLRNAINYLKKEYGSVMGYIADGLEIGREEIAVLKEKYLI